MAGKIFTLEEIEALYNSGDYEATREAALTLIDVEKQPEEVWTAATMFFGKAYLFSLASPLNEERNNGFLKSVKLRARAIKTLEEMLDVEEEFLKVYEQWKAATIGSCIEVVVEEPTFDVWEQIIPIEAEYSKLALMISMTIRFVDNCEQIIDDAKLANEEITSRERKPLITEEEVKSLYYDAACRIYNNALAFHKANMAPAAGTVSEISKSLLEALMVAALVMDCSINDKDMSDEVRVKRLLHKAEIITYTLEATIVVGGKVASIHQGDRYSEVQRLKEIYELVGQLDPSFTAPASLPDVEPIAPASSGSGGCYVATAVYGSYDCPQVWTLRRFRDFTLAQTFLGRAFIKAYYEISPTLVRWFGEAKWFKALWKPVLDKMVERLNQKGVENTPYED